MTGKKLRWGIVATGGIAEVMVGDLGRVTDCEVAAVSSRTAARAEEFAGRHGIPLAHGDYRLLVADPDVDVVYVATPHAQHHEVARAALLAGKHVLCEKPLTTTVAHTEELVALARGRGLFLMEAMWTRFNPLIRLLRDLVAAGTIGTVHSVRADFGFAHPYEPTHRLWNPALGGGSVLDLGIYPVAFAHMLLGEPTSVRAHGRLAPNGVDAEAAMLLGHDDGSHALLGSSLVSQPAIAASVIGAKGRVELPELFFRPSVMTVIADGESKEHRIELDGAGYTYQLRAAAEAIRAGALECPEMPHDDTIAIARTLAAVRDQLGVA